MSPTFLSFALWSPFFGVFVRSQSSAQTFFPASIPLANRSPYLSAWYNSTRDSSPLSECWPTFSWSEQLLGWSGKLRVDGVLYEWMSHNTSPTLKANVTNVQITPTRSIFTYEMGPIITTITFFSPIEPSDWVLQSLPFSYLSLEATASDGKSHRIQVYSDITADWLSGNRSSAVMWSHNTSSSSIFHKIQLQSPEEGAEEINQQAQDGTAYYAIANIPGITWQIGHTVDMWDGWNKQGNLPNNASITSGPIIPVPYGGALALDLGMIQSTSKPITWALGYVRDPSIIYTAPDSTTHRLSPYFVTKYGTNIGAAIDDFLSGYDEALERAIAFDTAVIAEASSISSEYANLVSLAARQTLSTLDVTVSIGFDGKPNASDVRIFMKNIGEANSITGRVNPVETIYAALPALLYFNASLVGPLLAPLLEAQDSPDGFTSTIPYAAQDIGLAYPNATGAHWPHRQGVEESGNMLVMLYAHAKFTGDGSLLRKHYSIAKRLADYLVETTLNPSTNQLTADYEGAAGRTNLAIKGIIAVKAMAQISQALGEDSDVHEYSSQAAALFGQWQPLALSSDKQHMLGAYNDEASWALMYNLYADRLLGTNIVNQTLLQSQTAFYRKLLGTGPTFGLTLDNTAQETSTAWLLFTAATVLDDDVRDGFVHGAWARASSNVTIGPFPDHYDAQSGAILGGSAGPAVGGVFSLLALNLPSKNITTNIQSQPQGTVDHPHTPVGAMAGGIAGGVAFIALIATGVFFMRRRHHSDISPPEPHRSASSAYTSLLQSQNASTASYENRFGSRPPGQAIALAPLKPNESNISSIPYGHDNQPLHLDTSPPFPRGVLAPASYVWGDGTGLASSQGSLSSRGLRNSELGSRRAGSGSRSCSGERFPTVDLGLRAEVENLRRAMQEMQERQDESLAPPPSYYTG